MRLIFKNLNILRSTINAISMNFDPKGIVESAGTNLPHLFRFTSFGLLWKEDLVLHLYEEEACPPPFTKKVVENMVTVLSILGRQPIDVGQVKVQIERGGSKPDQAMLPAQAVLKSHLTLPLPVEGEVVGCISLNSREPNAFDVQDLQFFSVIGYQISATLKHCQQLSSIKNIAVYDTLTNLHNRRYFEEKLAIETEKSFFTGTPLSLMMVDIDHFKKVNDTYGHPVGDKLLCHIASLLKSSVRKDDTVARYGGEEFVLILPGASLEVSFRIAERIRDLVEKSDFETGLSHLRLTVSIGISSFPTHRARSKEELVKMADQALYSAKRGGRNQVRIFTP
ncbi:MAG: GGDEF domain-containing protein [Syntrophaceae bacterium]|nr:GGDEF domain-containing protein [Syntrophaceae bacterium]